jgi:hypothetical protein
MSKYNEWLNKKPEIIEDCIMVTAIKVAGEYHYGKFNITTKENVTIASTAYDESIYYKYLKADKYFLIKPL